MTGDSEKGRPLWKSSSMIRRDSPDKRSAGLSKMGKQTAEAQTSQGSGLMGVSRRAVSVYGTGYRFLPWQF